MKAPASFRWFSFAIIWILALLVFPINSLASSIFNDDFVNLDTNFWEIFAHSVGDVKTVDGTYLTLSAIQGYSFPYVYLKNVTIPDNNFTIETKFKFSGTVTYGNGLIFSDKLLSYGTYSDLASNDLIFAAWPLNSTTVDISSSLCLKDSIGCTNGSYVHIAYVPSDVWTEMKIEEIDGRYILTVGGQSYETRDSSRKISHFWIGNPQTTTQTQIWPSIHVDYFGIYNNSIVNKFPIIVLPGFGGSWDIAAILSGTSGNNWEVPEQITVYDGLLNSLKINGYEEDKDIFLFPYDWRKPLDALADDLKNFITNKGLANKKIDMIGHSMGGLVARAYAQKYGVEKIDKIITAGSPHFGLVDSYGLWEGAVFWGNVWWEKALLSLTTELNRVPGERKIDTLRRVAPSILDLSPTNDFLYLNNLLKPWSNLLQKNLYLGNLNSQSTQVDAVLFPLWSDDEQTRSSIKTTMRNRHDSLMGTWEDGKPIKNNPFNLMPGDGTVTKESAIGPFSSNAIEGSGNHISVISAEQNIQQILNNLGVSSDSISGSYSTYPSSVFIASLRSPGRLEVCDLLKNKCNNDLGLYFSGEKLFMLPGYVGEELRVRVYEAGLGNYSLHLGSVTETDTWAKIDGRLQKSGQVDTFDVINGEPFPFKKEHCLKDGWKKYTYVKFKNQGYCVSYVEKHEGDHND